MTQGNNSIECPGQFAPVDQGADSAESNRRRTQESPFGDAGYSTIFQASRDALLIADGATGMILDANAVALALFGRSLEEFRTLHQTAVHCPEDVAAGREAFQSYRKKPGSTEHVVLRADGKRIPVEITAKIFAAWRGFSTLAVQMNADTRGRER